MTHTYAILEVSHATYDEIAERLRAASSDTHSFHGDVIDMHGIALKRISLEVESLSVQRRKRFQRPPQVHPTEHYEHKAAKQRRLRRRSS